MTVVAPPLSQSHIPVMLQPMLTALAPKDGERYVDGTFGAGGYSRAILQSAQCEVFAIDRDPHVAGFAAQLQQEFPNRFVLLSGAFSQMVELLAAKGIASVDGVVLDIGVSSMQIDLAERGFSFRQDGPLDMRMSSSGLSAGEVVNRASEQELADIIYHYGEEHAARRIAKAIVQARAEAPIETTRQLAAIVARVVKKAGKTDPATKTFQALRIHVNDELGELTRALEAAEKLLAPGGRLVVVTFHSLEDRIVKQFMAERSGVEESVSRYVPQNSAHKKAPSFRLSKKSAAKPSDEECNANTRARSAKLRCAIRTDAPVSGGGAHA